MEPEHKSRLYLIIYILFAALIGYIFWYYVRPKILLATCSDAAVQASNVYARTNLPTDNTDNYENVLDECLKGLKVEKPASSEAL